VDLRTGAGIGAATALAALVKGTLGLGFPPDAEFSAFGEEADPRVRAASLTGWGGLGIGEVASYFINKYSPLPAYVPLWAIGMGLGISAAVGIVFGLWPAWKAARLNPIDALRWE